YRKFLHLHIVLVWESTAPFRRIFSVRSKYTALCLPRTHPLYLQELPGWPIHTPCNLYEFGDSDSLPAFVQAGNRSRSPHKIPFSAAAYYSKPPKCYCLDIFNNFVNGFKG